MIPNPIRTVTDQRKLALSIVLWIVLVATSALGLYSLQFQTWDSVIALFALALICLPLMWLNSRGRAMLAASILSAVALIVITVNLWDGDGIRDFGILAYPIFILMGMLFFGTRSTLAFTLAAIGSLVTVAVLEVNGQVQPTIGVTTYDVLVPMIILLLIAAAINWVIVRNLERYVRHVEDSDAELRETYFLTLEAWARVLEYRHRETEGHSRRVVDLSVRLARALGCTEEDIGHLRHGALVHDIGKLAIPDSILLKPGPLTEEERQLVQKHPAYAMEMLAGVPFLEPAVCVAYSHHERWDGGGYPQGLKADEIPLLARIFAVVDTWDALGSERPYRPPWPAEQIVAHIKASAGSLFDPRVVGRFLEIVG